MCGWIVCIGDHNPDHHQLAAFLPMHTLHVCMFPLVTYHGTHHLDHNPPGAHHVQLMPCTHPHDTRTTPTPSNTEQRWPATPYTHLPSCMAHTQCTQPSCTPSAIVSRYVFLCFLKLIDPMPCFFCMYLFSTLVIHVSFAIYTQPGFVHAHAHDRPDHILDHQHTRAHHALSRTCHHAQGPVDPFQGSICPPWCPGQGMCGAS